MPESHESLPQTGEDVERYVRINRMLEAYFPEDIDFVLQQLHDDEDEMNFLYGQLLEIGENPDEVFAEYGITEATDEV